MKFVIIFFILSTVNVIFSTVKSILTIKSGKTIASLVNGGYFAFYNVMILYTVADFPIWQKCIITFICNVAGVYIVKLIEEKSRKAKLWRVELTVNNELSEQLHYELKDIGIPHYYISDVGKRSVFSCYCATKKESTIMRNIANKYNARYFVAESKEL